MALDGFYAGDALVQPRQTGWTRSQALEKALGVATKTSNDEHPRPFDFTRASPALEKELTEQDLPRALALSGRTSVRKPVLWVDGPVDFALTIHALFHRTQQGTPHVNPQRRDWITSRWGNERWDAARQRVAELPRELLRETQHHGVRSLAEGTFDKLLEAKITFLTNRLPSTLREVLTSTIRRSPAGLEPLRLRLNGLAEVQGLLGNQAALYSHRTPARSSVSEHRFDVGGALSLLDTSLRSQSYSRNRSYAQNLHGVFNYGRASTYAYYAFLNQLNRDLLGPGSNWSDEDAELIWKLAENVTAHLSLTTFEIFSRGPVRVNLDRTTSVKTLDELENTPTAAWADGTTITLIDNVELAPDLINAVRKNPAALLEVRNVEQRRALLRIVGNDALLKSVKSKQVAEDEFGQLHELPNKSQFVIVKNATPEPDGTVREYVLGARGNGHRTARSAVASTWGLREDQYWPVKET